MSHTGRITRGLKIVDAGWRRIWRWVEELPLSAHVGRHRAKQLPRAGDASCGWDFKKENTGKTTERFAGVSSYRLTAAELAGGGNTLSFAATCQRCWSTVCCPMFRKQKVKYIWGDHEKHQMKVLLFASTVNGYSDLQKSAVQVRKINKSINCHIWLKIINWHF